MREVFIYTCFGKVSIKLARGEAQRCHSKIYNCCLGENKLFYLLRVTLGNFFRFSSLLSLTGSISQFVLKATFTLNGIERIRFD